MGEPSFRFKVRMFIGGIGWRLFLWSIKMTQDEYFECVIEDARREAMSEKNSAWFTT